MTRRIPRVRKSTRRRAGYDEQWRVAFRENMAKAFLKDVPDPLLPYTRYLESLRPHAESR